MKKSQVRLPGRCLVLIAAIACFCGCVQTTPAPEILQPRETMSVGEMGTAAGEVDSPKALAQEESDTKYYDGNEQFVQHAPQFAGSESLEGAYELTFVDTDIRTVIDAVLGKMLGLRYQLDPRVNGTLSLESSSPVGRDVLLQLLETALQVSGFAMVDSNGGYAIVPYNEAPKRVTEIGIPSPSSRSRPGFSIQVVPLRYTSAAEMRKVLEPFAPSSGILRVDTQRNLLVLAGTRQELSIMRQAIQTFDVDWLKGMSFAMFRLSYVDAKTIADEILQVLGEVDSPIIGLVRLIPVPRLNAILALSPHKRYLREIEVWVERLDLGGSTPGRRIFVYDVQNGDAARLAESLNSILGQPTVSAGDSVTGPAPLDSRLEPAYTNETDSIQPPDVFSAGQLRIVPDVDNNSLLILATPTEFSVVEAALQRMDVPRRQVLIEASVAEVSLTDELRYGVQWFFEKGENSFTLSESSSGNPASEFPGFSYVFTGSPDRTAVLNAIASLTEIDVLSAPKLMVLNNQEAIIQVGDQVPIAVQSAVTVLDPSAPIVNSVQFRDTGVILSVTPRINEGGLVLLDVSQELSEVTQTTTSGIDSPTIQQRKISTTVAVRDGETIALGGLIRDSISENNSGIPFLKDIPIIGFPFRSRLTTKRRTELIVLITPRIISDAHSLRRTMQYIEDEFRNTRPFASDDGTDAEQPQQ